MSIAAGTKVLLARHALESVDWHRIVAEAIARFKWRPDAEVFAYSESAHDCRLDRVGLSNVTLGDRAFEGRLFDGAGEARWRARDDGRFDAWLLSEASPGAADAEPAIRVAPQKFFLIGRGTTNPGEFREGRYPGTRFRYPVGPIEAAEPSTARAYIEVQEYYRAEPAWKEVTDEVERLLNEPLLLAHRFVGVGLTS